MQRTWVRDGGIIFYNPPIDRCPCVVPHCRRTSGKMITMAFVCGKHWRMVPKKHRLFQSKLKRKLARGYNAKTANQEWRTWIRCARLAIKRAL